MVDKPRDMFDAIRRTVSRAQRLGLGIDALHIHPDDNLDGHDVIWGQSVTPDLTIRRGYVLVKVSGVMAADWAQDEQLVT